MTNEEILQAIFGKPIPGVEVYQALQLNYRRTLTAALTASRQAKITEAALEVTFETVLLPLAEGSPSQQALIQPLLLANQQERMKIHPIINDLLAYENRLTGWSGSITAAKPFDDQAATKPQPSTAAAEFLATLPTS